ncbi:MAG: sugar porter family MFS transporter, partial [Bacteroidales bacterium]|nr:sugar porter family MFS transporter [Bacteroidales bacterium]
MKKTWHPYLLLISAISAMGGFLFGYDWVVIGGAKPFYEVYFNISESPGLQGFTMSSALIGCLVGALMAGRISDLYGRKPVLVSAALLFILSAIGTGFANGLFFFNVYRIIGGFGIGIASGTSPMYIAEVAPANVRGKFVSLNQLTIVLGILSAQLVNWQIAQPVPEDATSEFIRSSWNGTMGWRWMFWAETLPAGLFLITSLTLPESPRWLIIKGRIDKAKGIFSRIGGEAYAASESSLVLATSGENKGNGYRLLLSRSMRKVIIIGVVLAVLQQWCGINVIFNYAHEIFTEAGYGVSDVLMNIVITGITNLVFTLLALSLVDRWGRRLLLIFGTFGLTVIYLFMGTAYFLQLKGIVLLIIVVTAIACYAMTLAPVVWVVISEIFPNRIRGAAVSLATFALWSSSFVLTYTFP